MRARKLFPSLLFASLVLGACEDPDSDLTGEASSERSILVDAQYFADKAVDGYLNLDLSDATIYDLQLDELTEVQGAIAFDTLDGPVPLSVWLAFLADEGVIVPDEDLNHIRVSGDELALEQADDPLFDAGFRATCEHGVESVTVGCAILVYWKKTKCNPAPAAVE